MLTPFLRTPPIRYFLYPFIVLPYGVSMDEHELFWITVAREADRNIPGIWDDIAGGDVYDIMRLREPFCSVNDLVKPWTPEVRDAFLDRYAEAGEELAEYEWRDARCL